MMKTPSEKIKYEFDIGELNYLDAVIALQNLGWLSEDAEDAVVEWQEASSVTRPNREAPHEG